MTESLVVETYVFKGHLTDLIGKTENDISPPLAKPRILEGTCYRTFTWRETCRSQENGHYFPVSFEARLYKGNSSDASGLEPERIFAVGIRSEEFFFFIEKDQDTQRPFFVALRKAVRNRHLMNWVGKDKNGDFVNLGYGL